MAKLRTPPSPGHEALVQREILKRFRHRLARTQKILLRYA